MATKLETLIRSMRDEIAWRQITSKFKAISFFVQKNQKNISGPNVD